MKPPAKRPCNGSGRCSPSVLDGQDDLRDTLEQIGHDIRDVFSPPENSEGPIDSGNIDPGSIDSGYVDLGTVDFGNTNPGPIDSGYVDPGPVDCSDYGRFRTLRAE